jgi:hypothetical protein
VEAERPACEQKPVSRVQCTNDMRLQKSYGSARCRTTASASCFRTGGIAAFSCAGMLFRGVGRSTHVSCSVLTPIFATLSLLF